MSTMSGLQEVKNLFDVALEDLEKTENYLENKALLKKCADRLLKLSQRLYDIWKLFDEEFSSTLDLVAAKCILLFARTCMLVSHKVIHFNWTDLHETDNGLKNLATLPRRAARRVRKRTLLRKKYQFQNDKSEYENRHLSKVAHEQKLGQRVFTDEIANVAWTLKDLSLSLVAIIDRSALISPEDTALVAPLNPGVFDLKLAENDLRKSWDIFADYLQLFLMDTEASDIDNLKPLLKKHGMKVPGTIVRKVRKRSSKTQGFYEINNTLDDLQNISKLLNSLNDDTKVVNEV
mmetsp:Transcript_15149/g.17159  ORF Transcript_15149/g.17159 Transcript_15149/m.17159 type:complete len:291 (+) Transcript_15149:269-1141(+)